MQASREGDRWSHKEAKGSQREPRTPTAPRVQGNPQATRGKLKGANGARGSHMGAKAYAKEQNEKETIGVEADHNETWT
jgi:hypothetical protein